MIAVPFTSRIIKRPALINWRHCHFLQHIFLTVFRVGTPSGKDEIFNVGKTNSYFLNCGYKQVWINYYTIYYTENSFSIIVIIQLN